MPPNNQKQITMYEFTISINTDQNGVMTYTLRNTPIESDKTERDFDFVYKASGIINEAFVIAPTYLDAICYLGSFMQVTKVTMKEATFVK